MCYNCGCGNPEDDHGNSANITTATFEKAAKASEQQPDEARDNTMSLLEQEKKSA